MGFNRKGRVYRDPTEVFGSLGLDVLSPSKAALIGRTCPLVAETRSLLWRDTQSQVIGGPCRYAGR